MHRACPTLLRCPKPGQPGWATVRTVRVMLNTGRPVLYVSLPLPYHEPSDPMFVDVLGAP